MLYTNKYNLQYKVVLEQILMEYEDATSINDQIFAITRSFEV